MLDLFIVRERKLEHSCNNILIEELYSIYKGFC
jgi:hypothetical protein